VGEIKNKLNEFRERRSVPQETKDYAKLGKSMEKIFEGGYLNHRRVYRINFMRGIFFGFGTFIGGTFVVAFLLWFLSLFGEIPFINDFVQTIRETVD